MFSIKSHLVIVEKSNLTSADKTKQHQSWQDQILGLYELDYSSQENMFKPCTKPKTNTTPNFTGSKQYHITLNMELEDVQINHSTRDF